MQRVLSLCTIFLARPLLAAFLLVSPALVLSARAAEAKPLDGLAESIVQRTGVEHGLYVVLGSDGNLALDLAARGGLLVHVREPDASKVAELRKKAEQVGLPIQRLLVERGSLHRLPHATNLVDVITSIRPVGKSPESIALDEILRALRPEGVAILRTPDGPAGDDLVTALKQFESEGTLKNITTWKHSFGNWVRFSKPVPEGTDDWSHWEKGPDNNPVSNDTLIQAPYMTQFLAGPYYIGMPSTTTAAAGRTFLAVGHIAHHRREWNMLGRLIARNGYNGTVLWERKLPEGYLAHRSAFVATRNTFYMIDGERCLMLDPQTGQEQGEIRIPGLTGQWKWMSIKDGVLYAMAGAPEPGAETVRGDKAHGGWSWQDLSRGYYGRRVPHGFGDQLAAYRLADKKVQWIHKEDSLIDSRGMALVEDKIFLYCPDKHFRALAIADGKILWTNHDGNTLGLIEQPGEKLTSTPGWRTQTMVVATPKVLVVQGQTRMNVVALSTTDGYLLWHKKKVTNNPNAIYIDGKLVIGVGPGGDEVKIDPETGEVEENLKFRKTACTRLTATTDSFFCRGEGMLRYDRQTKKLLIDGAARPACNDGAMAANGLLYLGPWSCDCNLSLIGNWARCSAGDFRFDYEVQTDQRLEKGVGDLLTIAEFQITDGDWPTYRGNNRRTGSTGVPVVEKGRRHWHYSPDYAAVPTVPVSAGGLVFFGSEDGKIRAIEETTGQLRWQFATGGVIKYPPTIHEGRTYFGSGDGWMYCVEAATGRLLWRFRAAPVERHVMAYGSLSSTWPVHSGVLVQDGVAYFAAGIIDNDGTYVYAVDAKTGELVWANDKSGHLNAEIRKGVSVQGNLAMHGDRLLLAGGNQISPAPFDLKTGACLASGKENGQPQANSGQFVGVFHGEPLFGGRILHSSPRNVANKNYFDVGHKNRWLRVVDGGIIPAWDDAMLVAVDTMHGKITACDIDKVKDHLEKTNPKQNYVWGPTVAAGLASRGQMRWQSNLGNEQQFECVSLAVAPNAVVAVVKFLSIHRARPQWFVAALDREKGNTLWMHELVDSSAPSEIATAGKWPAWYDETAPEPLPGGLAINRDGSVLVTMLDGSVQCFGK